MTLGSLVFLLDVDSDKFNRGIRAAGRGLSTIVTSSLKAGAGLMAMNSAVAGLGGLVAIVGQAAGAVALLPAVAGAAALAIGALKVGMSGFGDALSSMDDPAAFAEAIAKLSPAARDAALAVRDLRPAWDELKLGVQEQLFRGLGPVISDLGGKYLPMLKNNLAGVAAGFNTAAVDMGSWLSRGPMVEAIAGAMDNAKEAVRNVTAAISPLGNALVNIGIVGAEFLPGLTEGAAGAAERFADWAQNGDAVRAMIQTALDTLSQLGTVVGNVGSIFSGLFEAANASGGGLLNMLVLVTDQIATMVNSAAGQEVLGALFETGAVLATAFLDVLSALLPAVSPLIGLIAQLAQTIGVGLAEVLIAIMPAVSVLVEALAGALQPVLPVLADLFSTLAGILGPLALTLAETLAPILPQIADLFVLLIESLVPLLPPIAQLAQALLPVLGAILSSIVIPAIRLVLGVLGEWWGVLAFGLTLVANFVSGVVGFFSNLGTNVDTIINNVRTWIANGFENARTSAVNAISGLVSNGIAKFHEILGFVGSLPGRLVGLLAGLPGLLVNSGRALVDGFRRGIESAWNGLVGMVQGGIQRIRNLFPFSPAKDGPLSGAGYVTHSGAALTSDFAASLRGGLPAVANAAQEVMAAARAALAPITDQVATTQTTEIGRAAQEVLARMNSGGHMFEDLTWRGASSNVGRYNDELLNRADAAGVRPEQLRAWLEQFVAAQTTTRTVEIHNHNPMPERASDAIGRAGSVLAALGPWGDTE